MRLRVLCMKTAGLNRAPDILAETPFDTSSKVRVCIRTLQRFQHLDPDQLKMQVCRVSHDNRWVDTARAVPFESFRKLVVDQWIFGQVRRGRLKCFYQPIMDTREPTGAGAFGHEALVRCQLPGDLTINANDLFSLAYSPKLRRELHTAALWCCLRGSLKTRGTGKLFVNIDPGQVHTGGKFWTNVSNLLNENGVSSGDVVFEIVEPRQIRSVEVVRQFCLNARNAGFQIALDDFGVQTDPFQLLLTVRPDYIKLEPSLVRGCQDDPWRLSIAENLISLARRLSIQCIVEGIEEDIDLAWANHVRTPLVQGYRFGMPSPEPVLTVNYRKAKPPGPHFKSAALPLMSNTQLMAGNPLFTGPY